MSEYQLSSEQIASYHAQGFLFVGANEHRFLNVAQLQAWTNEVRTWPQEKGKWMPYDEVDAQGNSQLMRTECFVDYHEGLQKLLCGDDLLSIMAQLAGNVR